MRQVAAFDDERRARHFADVLCTHDIDTDVSTAREGAFAVWVMNEDDVETARAALARFEAEPDAEDHVAAEGALDRKRRAAEDEAKKSRHRVVDMRKRFHRPSGGPPAVTFVLVAASVGATLAVTFLKNQALFDLLAIGPMVEAFRGREFEAVLHGAVWRLVTPIFIHLSFLHILFNMWWLVDLGGALETRLGPVRFLSLVLVTAVISNVAQYAISGSPAFGGMSGVIYALVGYIWVRERLDRSFGLGLPPNSMLILMVWLVLGFVGAVGAVANITHLGGLLAGGAFGALAAFTGRR
jgi:GlpG protein